MDSVQIQVVMAMIGIVFSVEVIVIEFAIEFVLEIEVVVGMVAPVVAVRPSKMSGLAGMMTTIFAMPMGSRKVAVAVRSPEGRLKGLGVRIWVKCRRLWFAKWGALVLEIDFDFRRVIVIPPSPVE